MKPLEAPVMYFRIDESTAARYCVDIDVYTRSSALALVERAPEAPADENIDIGGADISADELASELDPLAPRTSARMGA